MREILKSDITIKTVSVLFAVLLWFFVSYSMNPLISTSIDIPLRVTNENTLQDKGLLISNRNFPRTISVTVRGKKDKISSLNFNDLDAVADLSKVKDIDTTQVDVDVYLSKSDITIEDIKPKTLSIQLEKIGKNPFPVEVITTGKLKDNYKIVSITTTPQAVALNGADSLIKSVSSVKVYVDVNNLDRDLTVKKDCMVYDKEGRELSGLDKGISVEVRLGVGKEVPITASIKGKPAQNYVQSNISVNPAKTLIVGSPDVLEKVSELYTETIDVEGSSQVINAKKTILLPSGISLVDAKKDVSVNVTIDPITTRDIVISKDDIGVINADKANSMDYEILTGSVDITLKGGETDIQQLDADKLKPSIDVGNLTEGTFKVPIRVILPGTAKLVQDYSVDVRVTKK